MDTSQFHGPRDYLDAARSPEATAEDLRTQAGSEYDFVRLAVAEHPSTPTEALATLAPASMHTWNEQRLCLRLAEHPNTPVEVLVRIADSVPPLLHVRDAQEAFGAGVALSRRDDLPLDVLLRMVRDSRTTTEFKKVLARETTRSDVLDSLREDPSERVRRAVERRS